MFPMYTPATHLVFYCYIWTLTFLDNISHVNLFLPCFPPPLKRVLRKWLKSFVLFANVHVRHIDNQGTPTQEEGAGHRSHKSV